MNKNKRNLDINTANQRQRFSIRKLSIGAASVLLGTTFLFAGQTVQAASTPQDAREEVAQEDAKQQTSEKQVTDAKHEVVKPNVDEEAKKPDTAQKQGTAKNAEQEQQKTSEVAQDKQNQAKKAAKDVQKDNSNKDDKEQNKTEVKTNTLSLTKPDGKSALNQDALKASKAVAKTNSEKPKDSQKAQDEIHATLNFRNTDTVIKSVTLTGKPGQTVYDALGGKDVYSYILEDYPSYMLLPGAEYKSKVIYTTQSQDKPGLTKYFNDPQLITDYENWHKEYQDGKHPLFDYLPTDDLDMTNQSLLSGETPLSDKSTYTVEVVKQTSRRSPKGNVYRLEDYAVAGRNINYNKYLGKDKTEKLAYQVKNGIVWTAIGDTIDAPMPVYEALNTHGRIPAHLSKVEYDGNTGLPMPSGTYGKGQVTFTIDYPKETAENRKAAEQSGDLTEWSTLDDLVDEIPYTGEYGEDYKTTIEGNSTHVTHNGNIPGNPPDQNIMYYANRKFNVIFKDITYGDGDKAIELTNYDYTDPNQMTMAANSKKNPHNGADNGNYQAYKVDADVYHGKLDDLRNAGYAIVSTDVDLDGQTYSVDEFNKDKLYNSDGTIKPKTYVVKVLRGVKEFTPQATAKREVNYKANSKDGKTLKDPITQEVSLTGDGTYYTDATIKDSTTLVNTKEITDLDGNKVRVVDSENTAPVEVTWQIDSTKNRHDVTKNGDKFDFEKPAGLEAPETIGAWSHVASLDINNVVDHYSPVNKDNKTLEPVYLIYKQKATAHTIHKTITRTIHYVTGGSNHEVLQDPVTQTANLSSTYYTDQDGKEVATTKIDGVHYVDPDKSVPARTWSVDSTGNTEVTGGSFDEKAQDVITVENGKNKGTWSIEYAANNTADSEHLSDKFAPEKVIDTALPDKSHFDVYLVYTKDVNADITYWDITDGMEHKVKLGKTDRDNDEHGKTGSEIYFNNNEKRISDLENQHYIYVDTDFNKGDKYGTEDSHFNVYFRHAVKEITPNTPIDEVPKDKNGNPVVDPKSLHKEFTRNIYFKANTEDGATLKDPIPQKVEFNGTVYVDLVDNTTTTPETVKDINGNDVQVATKQSGAIKWDADSKTLNEVKQDTITLNKGDKHATSDDLVGTWYQVSGKADEVNLRPASDNPQDETLVYKQKAQYNIHYIDVNGVEDKDAYALTDGHELTDHRVSNVGEGDNIYVGDTPDATNKLWSPEDYEKAGYVLVGLSNNARDDKLGKQTLTHGVQDQYVYLKHGVTSSTDKTKKDDIKSETTSVQRKIYYRDAQTGELVREELKKYGIDADVPDITQTVDYVRVPLYDAFNGSFLGFAALYVDPNGFAKLDKNGKPEIKKDSNGQPIIATQNDKDSWVPTGKHTEYPEQGSPDLTQYGYKKARALESRDEDKNDGGKIVENKASDPTKNGDDVNVYYFHDQLGVTSDKPEFGIDVKDLKKTFTRTIVYRGTKDGGKTYQDVNGSPKDTHKYEQSVTFTCSAVIDKVTKKVLSYTDWTSEKPDMDEVVSKKPNEVGYNFVDIEKVGREDVDPTLDKSDLGTYLVTYTYSEPEAKVYNVTTNYVDEEGHKLQKSTTTHNHENGTEYFTDHPTTITTEDDKTYEFKEVHKDSDKPSGDINSKDVEVTYVYKLKKPTDKPAQETHKVTVHYVDEEGNVIYPQNTLPKEFKTGEKYDVRGEKKDLINFNDKTYEFKEVKKDDKPEGSMPNADVDVTYIYKLKESPVTPPTPPSEKTYKVTVNFVDEQGNELQDSRHSDNHKDGSDYNETDHPTTITKDGKTYVYTRVEDDPTSGTIQGKDVVVTYVYKEVTEPAKDSDKEPEKENNTEIKVVEKNNDTKQEVSNEKSESITELSNETPAPEKSEAKSHTVSVTGNATKSDELPQTSSKSNNVFGALGLAIAAVGSLIGLGARKKKRD
ncbi:MucBP domain-containing protein [uncultured Lactobacillus sp.]|uniref:MucBP domain-containing protein n=1 Tax=uncultured Lactobacillus sp. TaxID=153152 RepID=UPI002615EE7C|nr:MucBP domain-containing protein [uncultured Lactobacillus sp.]